MKAKEERLKEAKNLIRKIRPLKASGRQSPHKYLFLIALGRLYHHDIKRNNQFPLDKELETTFREVCYDFFPKDVADKIMIEYPYYHLSSDSIWHLKIKSGKEKLFFHYQKSPNMRLTRQRLTETVSYAHLENTLDECFRYDHCRESLIQLLSEYCKEEQDEDLEREKLNTGSNTSLFQHEAHAISIIQDKIDAFGMGRILSNLELHDPQSNRYFETDIVLVTGFGIYVIELKHWSGLIEIQPHSWIQNKSFYRPDPHKGNGFKAKLVRGLYERKFPSYPRVYVESVVVFTNPESTIQGASLPRRAIHNPTLDSIDGFFDYLKFRKSKNEAVLRPPQVDAVANYLSALNRTPRPRDFVFPDYEIIDKLYQNDDRAEVIARPTDVRHRRLTRLRIFFPPTKGTEAAQKVSHERATATLNAVAKIGDHPNILKVWRVPNDYGFTVEGSDWSETGTLRDFLDREGAQPAENAIAIITGILLGLEAVHRESVIHRALLPENVLLVGEIPKLMNFDLSYQLEDNRTTVIPDVSKLKRSPYIAPEIYTCGPLTEAADLFSVGVFLYELLTGERPFRCSTDLERTSGHLGDTHASKLQALTLPGNLIELVSDLIQLDPNDRPSQAEDVLVRLSPEFTTKSTRIEQVNTELPSGETHDVFEIEKLIAHGAASQIYRARGPMGRQVAIKLFNADVAIGRIIREQEFVAALRHPSIVRVDNLHSWKDGRFYLPFDWISGRSLREEIKNTALPDLTRFGRTATQLLEAFQALHAFSDPNGRIQPILHNDIKPENILIDDSDRAVLIDFGSASNPRIGLYEGTEGYVAPDLRLGEDRSYCEDGDLFALAVTLFEWFSGQPPYKIVTIEARPLDMSEKRQDAPIPLIDWFGRAVATEAAERFSSAEEMGNALVKALRATRDREEETTGSDPTVRPISPHIEAAPDKSLPIEQLQPQLAEGGKGNPFVPYLNSLHSREADSENSLAESQARQPLFSHIHVPNPITTLIQTALTQTDQHVILTGHAGDGKSTIGVELYKRLNGLPGKEPLNHDLPKRAEMETGGQRIVLIKDLSEWAQEKRQMFLSEALGGGCRFFIVTNTGTFLDTFREYERSMKGDWAGVESLILEEMGSPRPQPLAFRGTTFSVINLSMVDNLRLVEEVFCRMIATERWSACGENACKERCPIYLNITMIRENEELVRQRLFLLYRRMHEYGTRLTIRQLTAHFAYMITSGLMCRDIVAMGKKAKPPELTEFMFYNRFFGDNGREPDSGVRQLRAVREIRRAKFGFRPCPSWERRLWTRTKGETFTINARGCSDKFRTLRAIGAKLKFDDETRPDLARLQVRRMVYFLHDFGERDKGIFLKTFLDSPMILDFFRWQTNPSNRIPLGEKAALKQRILHVLQEHFTGVRLPEGGASLDRDLFITLNRRSNQVRQSAQIVLARIPEDDLQLELVEEKDGVDNVRRQLKLCGRGGRFQTDLKLELPFLDYVMMRNQGEIGNALLPSYSDRLDRYRGRLIKQAGLGRGDDVMLVRLRTNHTFRRQVFAVRDDRLEVTNG